MFGLVRTLKRLVQFCGNSLKISVLIDIDSENGVQYYLVVTLWRVELKNGQHHHGKLKSDVGLTFLIFRRNPECCDFLPEIL